MSERPDLAEDSPTPDPARGAAGSIVGWTITGLGIAVTLATIAVSLYVILSADTTEHFAALLISSSFFAAFPLLMGLGLILWGRTLVLRSRSAGGGG